MYPEFQIKDFLNKFTELLLENNNQYRSLKTTQYQLTYNEKALLYSNQAK
jgi:hypothetical protein